MYRIHVSVIRAQGQCPPNFMPSLEGYSFNSGYILTLVKENAQNTCPWPFMVPVMGLITFALSNQNMHGCLAILFPLNSILVML